MSIGCARFDDVDQASLSCPLSFHSPSKAPQRSAPGMFITCAGDIVRAVHIHEPVSAVAA
jgi:hypothetical protein